MGQNAAAPDGSEQDRNRFDPIFEFLGKMGDLAALVMEEAPWWGRLITFVVLCGLVVMIVTVSGPSDLTGDQRYWLSIVTELFFLVALLAIFAKQFQKKGKTLREHPKVPVQPLLAAESPRLSTLLQEIRDKAFDYLHTDAKINGIQDDNVRANVFLLDSRSESGADVCTLYMPENLRKNMFRPEEWELRFKAGQGLTGRVYDVGQHRIAHRLSGARAEWNKEFKLNRKQIASVHPDLKWIVSFPLKDYSDGAILGVLNVDGLNNDIEDATLVKMIQDALELNVKAFASALSQAPSMRILEVR